MNKKVILFFIILVIALPIIIWKGVSAVASHYEMQTLQRQWVMVRLLDGQSFYGHIAELGKSVMKIESPYVLEKYVQQDNGGTVNNMNSSEFSIGGTVDHSVASDRYVLTQKKFPMYLNRTSVLFWEQVDPASEVGRYLK
jgi:hypothetical protein